MAGKAAAGTFRQSKVIWIHIRILRPQASTALLDKIAVRSELTGFKIMFPSMRKCRCK